MSSRFLCADLNNVFYAHGGVQNPCYRSIVSNTDTFEMLTEEPVWYCRLLCKNPLADQGVFT